MVAFIMALVRHGDQKMSDIAILPTTTSPSGDIEYQSGDVLIDDGLDTAIFISLFTDAPDGTGQGGWWGDAVDAQPVGSLLWTLGRSVINDELLASAKEYCSDALQWLIDDDIAKTVDVTVEITGQFSIGIAIQITKADSSTLSLQYAYNWQAQANIGF